MSGFGTKKPGGDAAVQLTFPAVYSQFYAETDRPQRYLPSVALRPTHLQDGDGLQDLYHEQKRQDAYASVMNGVKDRKRAEYRFTHSHANYFGIPKASLSQRLFANPSNGNQADIYSARNVSQLRGGVLRSSEGQEWGRQKLHGRIAQLNAIDQALAGFQLGQSIEESVEPVVFPTIPPSFSDAAKLDLVGLFRNINVSIEAGKYDRIVYEDVIKLLKLLFRFAVIADSDELEDILEYTDIILANIEARMGESVPDDGEASFEIVYEPDASITILDNMADLLRMAREYTAAMLRGVSLSIDERKRQSANIIKALGFNKLSKKTDAAVRALKPRPQPTQTDADEVVDEIQRDQGRARFDPSPRNTFGYQSGQWFGEPTIAGQEEQSALRNPMRQQEQGDVGEERLAVERAGEGAAAAAAAGFQRQRGMPNFYGDWKEDEEDEGFAPSSAAASAAAAPMLSPRAAAAAAAAPARRERYPEDMTEAERDAFQAQYQAAASQADFMALAERMRAADFRASPRGDSSIQSLKNYFRRNFQFIRRV